MQIIASVRSMSANKKRGGCFRLGSSYTSNLVVSARLVARSGVALESLAVFTGSSALMLTSCRFNSSMILAADSAG